MVLSQKGRAWRLLFAVVIGSLFVGYFVFWRQTFVLGPAVSAVTVSETCGTCQDLASVLFAQDEDVSMPEDPQLDDLKKTLRADERDSLGRPWHRRPAKSGGLLGGPYALAVRQSLRGVLPSDTQPLAYGMPRLGDREAWSLTSSDPATLPTYGYMTSGFGVRKSPFHDGLVQHRGVDFAVPYGADIFATGDGEVAFSGWYSGLGRTVAIDHGGGMVTRYGHASSLLVNEGDVVRRGDVIAKAGNSGRSTGTHVHYEVWMGGRAVDPMPFMTDEKPSTLVADSRSATLDSDADAAHLGLAMGGDGSGLATVDAASLPRYVNQHLFRSNLFIVGFFALFSLFLVGILHRHEPPL